MHHQKLELHGHQLPRQHSKLFCFFISSSSVLLLLLSHVYIMLLQGALPHNPLVTHETDVRHLRDPAFLRGALRYRVVSRRLF
jgi:hypothetical protein